MLGRTGKQFLKYYILFFISLVLLFIPFYFVVHSMISRNYYETSAALLETGLTNFEFDLSQIEGISKNIYDNPAFKRIPYNGPDYSIQDYYNIGLLIDDFKRYFAIAGMTIEDCGIVFYNDVILTTKRIHFSGDNFYGEYFRQAGVVQYQDWFTLLSVNDNNLFASARLLPLAAFQTHESNYEAITYVRNFSNYPLRSSFYFATLEKNKILSRLATSEVLREGRVVMYDPEGNIFLDSNPDAWITNKSDLVSIDITGTKRGIRVIVDIPERIFTDKLAAFRNIAFVFTIIIVAVGIALSLFFAQSSARPVREIIEEVINFDAHDTIDGIPSDFKNDFKFIQHFISRAKWDYETFQEKMKQQEEMQRDNLLMQLLYGRVYTKEIFRLIESYFPDFPEKFCIAAIELPGFDETTTSAFTVQQTMIRNLVEPQIPRGGYVHFSGNMFELFFPDEEPEKILERLRNLASELENRINISVRIALSETVEDIRETYNAFYQVQKLLRLPGKTTEWKILQKENTASFSFSIEYLDTGRFYDLIMHAEEERIIAFVNNVFNELYNREYTDENDIQQLFFLYRKILIRVVKDLELDLNCETIIPVYDSGQDINSLFSRITESIRFICNIINSKNNELNIKFEQSIMHFVDSNITNPNLYTRMVTNKFRINENRLQETMRRLTGKTFLEYVESRRMTLAKELLSGSNKPVSKIARDCGYSTDNAFYKAFKRYYGTAPSDLRH